MPTMQRLRPSQVLGVQAELRERFTHPNADLLVWLGGNARQFDRVAQSQRYYPYQPGLNGSSAEVYSRAVGRSLFSAPSYQVSEKMVGILEDVYQNTLTGKKTEYVEPETLPAPYGFLWYDRPLSLIERTGGLISIRAISWSPQIFRYAKTDAFGREMSYTEREGIRILFWQHADDPTDYTRELQDNAPHIGDLQLNHSVVFPFGERFPVLTAGTIKEDGTERKGTSVLHWAVVTWMLLETEIAASTKHTPEKHARRARQVARSLKHNEITVITLRRVSKAPEDGHVVQHHDVDWSCCWIVESFWRHIDGYDGAQHRPVSDKSPKPRCTTCGARITRVRSHMRGPDWLPMKNPERLYLLKR
jgi:hypothetical protein